MGQFPVRQRTRCANRLAINIIRLDVIFSRTRIMAKNKLRNAWSDISAKPRTVKNTVVPDALGLIVKLIAFRYF